MKKITLFLLLLLSVAVKAQCIGSYQYPEDSVISNNYGTPQLIDDSWFGPCNYAGEFAVITSLQIGEDYVFDSDLPVYFTVTSSDNSTVIAEGFSPLTVTGITVTEVNLNIHTDSDCGEDTECKAITVQCESCVLDIPENDNLCEATALTLDSPSSGGTYTNLGSSVENGEPSGSCWFFGDVASKSVWFSFVAPASGNVRISTVFEDGTLSDTQLTLYEVGDCSDLSTLTELGCDEDDDNDLDENAGVLSILQYVGLTPGDTYYIQVDGYDGEMGTFDIGVFDIGVAELPECVENISPADGEIIPAFTSFDLSWTAPTTGGTIQGYLIYVGETEDDLQVFDQLPAGTTILEDIVINEYDYTAYWQIVPFNEFGEAVGCPVYSITSASQPTDTPDFVNLQWPPSITIQAGNSETVYGRVYEPGLTDTTSGQAPGILAWVGISPQGQNTSPDTWTTWIPATFNDEYGNDDEYQVQIGATLAPGTYYYATRFTLNGGPYVYGGINATNPETGGNFWDGTGFISGVLTVNPPPVPENDDCSNATVIVQETGITNVAGATPTAGTIAGSTDSGVPAEACAGFTGTANDDVWYSFEALTTNVNITYEVTGTAFDAVVQLYSGDCGALTVVACADGTITTQPIVEQIEATNLIVGNTYYTRIYQYSGTASTIGKSFNVKIWSTESLSNNDFDKSALKVYPNPTKDILNISYNQEISNVEIFNLVGQRVATIAPNANEGKLDISSLANGTYFVKVTSNNETRTVKVIKQ